MNLVKKIGLPIVIFMAVFCVQADTETVNGITWNYTVRDGEASVGGGAPSSPAVPKTISVAIMIPSTLGGYPVTSIGDHAFYYCSLLTNVTIPNSVTRIGIGAFEGCNSLKSVSIPESVINIGWRAFSGCSSLKEFIIDSNNTLYKSGNSMLFSKDGTMILHCSDSKTRIGIPNGVTRIGEGAFWGCRSLESVKIPNSVTSIGQWAFRDCTSLVSVTIPCSVENIGFEPFVGCSSLEEFVVDSDNMSYKSENGLLLSKNGSELINSPSGITRVTIPDSVMGIRKCAFFGCKSLKSVVIGNSVTSIGWCAFSSCSSLKSVTIGNSVTSIRNGAFAACHSLESVAIPNSVTNIDSGAFSHCTSLKEFVVDANNMSYKSENGLLFSKDGTVLVACPGAKTNVTLPNNVISIENRAFPECRSLKIVTIPDSVRNIGDSAFSYCSSLTSVFFDGDAPIMGSAVFNCVNRGCTAYVRKGSSGWNVPIPGVWNGINIEFRSSDESIPDVSQD